MGSLERVFARKEEQCAFLTAVAGFLVHLNAFASKKRSSVMIEYNVGGVVAAVEPLTKLANEHAGRKMHYTETEIDDLVETLCKAWYVRQDGTTTAGARPRSTTEYFNAELDPNGTLPIALAQVITSMSSLVDPTTKLLFSTCAGLLRRYAGFARTGSDKEMHFDDETGDEFFSLLRFFRSLYKLRGLELKRNILKAQELRHQGNEVFKSGRFGAAIAKYTEALLLDPTNYILYSNRAAAYTYLNATENAITDLKQAIELKNDFETAWSRLGFSYLARGNALESVKAYIMAIQLADTNGSLAQYIQKLVDSLSYAEQRALSQGITREELNRLAIPIRSIRSRFTPPTRSQSQQGSRQQSEQPGTQQQQYGFAPQPSGNGTFGFATGQQNGDVNQTFQLFTNGPEGPDAITQTLNALGNIFTQQQQSPQEEPQPQAQTNASPSTDRPEEAEPVDEEMADPETSVPPDAYTDTQNNTTGTTNQPRSLNDIIANVLPGAIRNTVAPILMQSFTNALNGGNEGQGVTLTTVTMNGDGSPQNTRTTTFRPDTRSNTANPNPADPSSSSGAEGANAAPPSGDSNIAGNPTDPDLDID